MINTDVVVIVMRDTLDQAQRDLERMRIVTKKKTLMRATLTR